MRAQLERILEREHVPRFGSIVDRPPILDTHNGAPSSSTQSTQGENPSASSSSIPGLRAFQEHVRHDIEQIDLVSQAARVRGMADTPLGDLEPLFFNLFSSLTG